jgi:PIN domain nuclease of toxin-antitoxin system
MKLLLDTHTFLWLVEESPKLSATAAAAIAKLPPYGIPILW